MFDASGSDKILYRRPTQRTISGSVTIFKKNGVIQADAKSQTQRDAVFSLLAATFKFTFTKFRFQPSSEDEDGETDAATMQSLQFNAHGVVVA